MSKVISVYDGHTRKRLAYLQNAYGISYIKKTDALWTAGFSLPFGDPKVKYCVPFNYVDIWDVDGGGKDRYVGLFRIMPREENTLGSDATIVFQLEHVLGTLLDDVMLGYHEVGNTGVYTDRAISYILERQSEQRWVLGDCEYLHQFLYGWQDENLLSALYSIVMPFAETDYFWDFNTTDFPWRISLRKAKGPVSDIRYRKNLSGLTRTMDPSNLTTRLYCYGYGNGDNKLGISDVNDGVPYLESPNISKYGVITQIWTDERFTIAESLKSVGENILKKLEEPTISYEIDIQTIGSASNLSIGDIVRVVSLGIDELMVVRSISKDDVTGAPQSGKIELGEGTIDISNSIAELAERQRISETYSQGAESIFTDSFVDNADFSNPAEVSFLIPDNVVHVNEIRFSCKLTNFRAYSKAVKGGGAGDSTTSDGGSSTVTSRDGGANEVTSMDGGGGTKTSIVGGNGSTTTLSGGGDNPTSDSSGEFADTLNISNKLPDGGPNVHNHGIVGATRLVTSVSATKNSSGVVTEVQYGSVSWTPSGDHQHQILIRPHAHSVYVKPHSHDIRLPSHSHDIVLKDHTHGINIPTHDHKIDIPDHHHDFTIPNHTHGIEYGIYKGPSASEMDIFLDDTFVGHYSGGASDINLIDYMSKNANGNVMRGSHTIRIVPNSMTRVECTFQIRLFTNMHGGSQY